MSKKNDHHKKPSSPASGPKVIVQQPSQHFDTITLEEALAQSKGKGLGLLSIPDMTPPGWEECAGIAASDMETMNTLTELAHRLQHSGEVRARRRAKKKKQKQSDSTADIVVDANDVAILRALDKCFPQLRTVYELEADTEPPVARKTIGKRLSALIDKGLAERPKGPRKGATITPAGKNLLANCPAPE